MGGGLAGGVGTGAGYVARALSGCGFDASAARGADARTPSYLIFCWNDGWTRVEVIGQALALNIAGGVGMRPMAERLGVPMTTARDWRRRFRVHALVLATALVTLAVQLDPAPVLLSGTEDHERAALEALGATWQRARSRFGERVPGLWRFWGLISGGRALGTNRSPPFARRSGADWMVLIP